LLDVAQDFEGAHLGLLSAPNLKLFQRMSTIYSDHYPARLWQILSRNNHVDQHAYDYFRLLLTMVQEQMALA